MEVGGGGWWKQKGVEVDLRLKIISGVVVEVVLVVQASGFRPWGVNPSVYLSISV